MLLDHEGCQVSGVAGQEDHSEESPHQHHDLTGGALGVFDGHRVVKHDSPQQPDRLSNGECGSAWILTKENDASSDVLQLMLDRFRNSNICSSLTSKTDLKHMCE